MSGNTEATVCIHAGSAKNAKNTPEMNCSTSTTGVTTAVAERPERGSDENATPHTAPAAHPSTNTHANVVSRVAASGMSQGIGTSYTTAARSSRSAVCTIEVARTRPTLP